MSRPITNIKNVNESSSSFLIKSLFKLKTLAEQRNLTFAILKILVLQYQGVHTEVLRRRRGIQVAKWLRLVLCVTFIS